MKFYPPALVTALLCLFAAPIPASGQTAEVPYWASIRSDEVNMRAGPGEDYQIAWVYRRAQLPLKVLRIKDGWRLVEDPAGDRGWILSRFLTRKRGAIVIGKGAAEMRERGDAAALLKWRVEPGVVGELGDCEDGWCRFVIGPREGYVRQNRLWGAGEP